MRRFHKLDVPEPSIEDTKRIMRGLQPYYEAFHNVKINSKALDYVVEVTDKYIQGRYLPDKAIDVMDMAGAKVRLFSTEEKEPTEITIKAVSYTHLTLPTKA